MKPTAVIAEDESLLAAQLKARLAKVWPELEVLATVGDGEAALEAIAEHQPDLVFLDIQMPELTGIEVARRLAADSEQRCHVVFVTAYDQYAVQAFEAGAADYLLKPYSEERLTATAERLRQRFAPRPEAPAAANSAELARLLSLLPAPAGERLRWIKAGSGDKLKLIPVEEVLFFQSDEKYTLVATAGSDALIRTTIRELCAGLDADQFWQIHRSTLVNARAIESVSRDGRGQAMVKVKGRPETLTVSRPYSHLFRQM